MFWGSLLHNLRLSAVANFLLPRFDQAMNPSAPSFKPAGGMPTPAIEGPTAAGTTNVDASLAIVPPRERQAGVVDHRVTPEALARLGAVNTPVPVDRMSTTSAVNSDEAMPYGPTLNLGFSQYNTQQNLHVSLDRSAEVAAVAEARHAELMTKKDALFVERLGAIQANAQAEYARLGKELDVSNQTIINQQREFAARMGFGQQQLDEAITTAIQAQKQNHDLQVSLVKAQARAEEESAKSDAIRRHMEAEARAKDESVQKELDSMRQALEDMRAQMLTAPGGGAASALQSDMEQPPPTFMGPSPGREAPGPSEVGMPAAGVPTIPIFTPPGLGPKYKDGGPPDDDDDDSDKDKYKKDKKSKKDKKRRKKKKRDSSSSSSSSDSSQVGKQVLKALMKQLKKGSKKDKKSDDEGTDGEKPKNKAKEAEKITFLKFPLPEQYRNWRIRVREAVVAASDKPDMSSGQNPPCGVLYKHESNTWPRQLLWCARQFASVKHEHSHGDSLRDRRRLLGLRLVLGSAGSACVPRMSVTCLITWLWQLWHVHRVTCT